MMDSNFDQHFVILGDANEVDQWRAHAVKNNWNTQVGVYPGMKGKCVLYETDNIKDAVEKLRAFNGFT